MQIIERKMKVDVNDENRNIQISYNSYGHLVIRFFDDTQPNKDKMIVFTVPETFKIINFIKKMITKGY